MEGANPWCRCHRAFPIRRSTRDQKPLTPRWSTDNSWPLCIFELRFTDGIAVAAGTPKLLMRELEASLQQFGEFILKARLVREAAAPYCVRWVHRFLARPASDEPLADQVQRFCEELERHGSEDWRVRIRNVAAESIPL